MRQIIVEGPDGAGKTTLVAQLLDAFHSLQQVKLFDSSGPRDGEHIRCRYEEIQQMAFPSGITPLFDRYYPSELVYGPMLRGEVALNEQFVQQLAEEIRDNGLMIYCRPPLETILERVGSDQMAGVHDHLVEIVKQYDIVMALNSGGPFITYDWTQKGAFRELEDFVESYLNGWTWTAGRMKVSQP